MGPEGATSLSPAIAALTSLRNLRLELCPEFSLSFVTLSDF